MLGWGRVADGALPGSEPDLAGVPDWRKPLLNQLSAEDAKALIALHFHALQHAHSASWCLQWDGQNDRYPPTKPTHSPKDFRVPPWRSHVISTS